MIEVKNGKRDGFIGANKIYIGRANKRYKLPESPLKNPFQIGKDGTREEVVEKFRRYLWKHCQQGDKSEVYRELQAIAQRVKQGEKVELCCWCKPLSCHGDVVKRCLEWMLEQ